MTNAWFLILRMFSSSQVELEFYSPVAGRAYIDESPGIIVNGQISWVNSGWINFPVEAGKTNRVTFNKLRGAACEFYQVRIQK